MRRKGVFWREVPENHFKYKFYFVNWAQENQLTLHIEAGARYGANQSIGTYVHRDETVPITLPYAGRVLQIFPSLPEDCTSKLQRDLFIFEQCDHVPRPNPVPKSIDYCEFCGQELWTYQDPVEIPYTRRDFRVANESAPIEWSLSLNQRFGKGETIGKMGDSDITFDFRGRITGLFNSQSREQPIIKVRKTVCKHQKIVQNVCSYCYAYVEPRQIMNSVPLAVQNKNVFASGRALQQIQQQMTEKLLSNKKLFLILDLDNTILHCAQTTENFRVDNLQDYFVVDLAVEKLVIKMRPHLKEFLRRVMSLFEIYIYTKGTRVYAEQICIYIRETYQELFQGKEDFEEYFTPKRIISRDQDRDLMKKNLKNILPTREDFVVILDDRKDVWNASDGLVHTKYFEYFTIHNNGQIQTPTVQDEYLRYATAYLEKLHRRFFNLREQNSEVDVRNVNRTLVNERLAGTKALLLMSANKSAYNRAIKMGVQRWDPKTHKDSLPPMVIVAGYPPYTPPPEPKQPIRPEDIVVPEVNIEELIGEERARQLQIPVPGPPPPKHRQGPQKINEKQKEMLQTYMDYNRKNPESKVPIVHELWIDFCYQYNYRFDIKDFLLAAEYVENPSSCPFFYHKREELEKIVFEANPLAFSEIINSNSTFKVAVNDQKKQPLEIAKNNNNHDNNGSLEKNGKKPDEAQS